MSAHSDPTCPVRIRLWDKDDGTFSCHLVVGHIDPHTATGLFPDQLIQWFSGDRREFVGEYVQCGAEPFGGSGGIDCYFPVGHSGSHA